MLLGFVFLFIVLFMPDGHRARRDAALRPPPGWRRAMTRAHDAPRSKSAGLRKSFGGSPCHRRTSSLRVQPGERRLIIGPNGAGKTTLFNLIAGDIPPTPGTIRLFGAGRHALPAAARAHLGSRAPTRSSRCSRRTRCAQRRAGPRSACDRRGWNMFRPARRRRTSHEAPARAGQRGPGASARTARLGELVLWREAARRDRDGARAKAAPAAARRAPGRPVAARSADPAAAASPPSRGRRR